MKYALLFFYSLLPIFVAAQINSDTHVVNDFELTEFQKKQNAKYADPEKSPMLPEDREHFTTLEFFEHNEKYKVVAKFVRTPDENPFEMTTTTDRRPIYVKYGEAHFEMDGKQLKLSLFQYQKLKLKEDYKGQLFLPFNDETNGVETYGGGRFIDLFIPSGDTVIIDFNEAYNPYCAYNHKYSCTIPPVENKLDVEIRAGVKTFDH
jgi:uncharacterized protein (DUF1684 family)